MAARSGSRLISFEFMLTTKLFELQKVQDYLLSQFRKLDTSCPAAKDGANILIEKLLVETDDIPLFAKVQDLNTVVKAEMRRLNIDEAFIEDAKTYLVDPEQEVRITTQQSPIKLNEIDLDVFDFKSTTDQQLIKLAPNETILNSERAHNDLLAGNSSIRYTEE